MKFYSQWGEDKVLLHLFRNQPKGFYVDVGALDGIKGSNTYLFELLGWKGICIEPHKYYFPKLVENRKCVCLDVAIWSENKETSDFYATEIGYWSRVGGPPSQETLAELGQWTLGGWRKYRGEKPYPYATVEIQHPKLRTLDYILREHKIPIRFDLLSIDVEGSEQHVLNGFSLEHYLPRVVIIEDLFPLQFKSYFDKYGYTPIRRKEYRVKRTNIQPRNTIYFRDSEDAETVKKVWHSIESDTTARARRNQGVKEMKERIQPPDWGRGREDYEVEYGFVDYRGKKVLDIGADMGSTADFFLRKGATEVIAVEGNKKFYAKLKLNAQKIKEINPVFLWIKSVKHFESLIKQHRPDIMQVDCDDPGKKTGCEKYLFKIPNKTFCMVPEYLIETHTHSTYNAMKAKCKENGYKIVKVRVRHRPDLRVVYARRS